MIAKEKYTGDLTNEELEKELSREGAPDRSGRGYVGTQDTGDQKVRDAGTVGSERNDESLDSGKGEG